MSQSVINFSDVSYSYENISALKSISFNLDKKERVLLIGANGAGKSTLLALAAELKKPTSGKVLKPKGVKVSYLGAKTGLYNSLSTLENLSFFGSKKTALELINNWKLKNPNKPVKKLSMGEQIRSAIACCMINSPDLVILDEPTATLDDEAISLLTQNILSSENTLLIASHDIERILPIATRIIYLENRTIMYDSSNGLSFSEILDAYRKKNR